MISIAVELEILRLIDLDLTTRNISHRTGAGRTTIDAVRAAGGLRPRPEGRQGTVEKPKRLRTPKYCIACRAWVTWDPCTKCVTLAWMAQKKGLTTVGGRRA